MRKWILLGILIVVGVFCLFSGTWFPSTPVDVKDIPKFDGADISWMLVSAALVLIMTPGLGFFYGGMVRKKNVISTILQSFIALGVITVLWFVMGFGLAFGPSIGGFIGSPSQYMFFRNVGVETAWPLAPSIPIVLFAVFQMKFAVITPALITGAFAERIRFWGYMLFIILFSIFIYAPLAHMVWHPDGLLFKYGVLDFAGGTVVHMSAGMAALAAAIFLKERKEPINDPSRITYVILGTSLLWFEWFGFNAGSALSANSLAVQAFVNTTVASAAAAIGWGFIEKIRGRKLSAMGVCIGAVVGLVAITPAAGFVTAAHSVVIGLVAVTVSSFIVVLRGKTRIDDTLDVFPCHGVGGIVGMILTGVFANPAVNSWLQNPGFSSVEPLCFSNTCLHLSALLLLHLSDLTSCCISRI